MNDEFAVWDEERNIWTNFCTEHLFNDLYCAFITEKEDNYTFYNYIGLKDIEDNKLYANSSIFTCLFTNSYDGAKTNLTGYLQHEDFKWWFVLINKTNKQLPRLEFELEDYSNIKIVDNIQENKLGLIK